jgi:ABC-type dipeptide/oligopeptide/nickel transport system permease component
MKITRLGRLAARVLITIGTGLCSVFGASVLAFVFLRVVPGNPVRLILGQYASHSAVDQLQSQLGIGKPIPAQYLKFIENFFTGNWGFSYSAGEPVRSLLAARFEASLELGLTAFLMTMLISTGLALLAARLPGSLTERAIQFLTTLGIGLPQFYLSLIALLLFSSILKIFPGPEGRLSPSVNPPPHITGFYTVDSLISGEYATFFNALWHLLLPALVLSSISVAFLTRLLLANLRVAVEEPYVLVYRSFGATQWRALLARALPNAATPTLATTGMIFGQLVVGAVFVEDVFQWPGVGALITQGIEQSDYSVVEVFVLLAAVAYVAVNTVIDILVTWVDPRARRPL